MCWRMSKSKNAFFALLASNYIYKIFSVLFHSIRNAFKFCLSKSSLLRRYCTLREIRHVVKQARQRSYRFDRILFVAGASLCVWLRGRPHLCRYGMWHPCSPKHISILQLSAPGTVPELNKCLFPIDSNRPHLRS